MITKITRRAGFRGTVAYALAREHEPEIVGGSMAERDTPELTRVRCHGQLSADVEKPVVHLFVIRPRNSRGRVSWR